MPTSLAVLVFSYFVGFALAQEHCQHDGCYSALSEYCPTTASRDCQSLLPATTITLPWVGPAVAILATVTTVTTVTEALGLCPPPTPTASVVAPTDLLKERQVPLTRSSVVSSSPDLSSVSPPGYGKPPSPTTTIIVPSYADRLGQCAPSAYASACSCLFGTNGPTVTEITNLGGGFTTTFYTTTTSYHFTILPNNCGRTVIPNLSSSFPNLTSIIPLSTTPPNIASSVALRTARLPTTAVRVTDTFSPPHSLVSSTLTNRISPTPSTPAVNLTRNCLTNEITDLLTDPRHCGACNNTCSSNDRCVNGICSVNACAGATCGNYMPCGTGPPNNGCSCYSSSEGGGFCMDDQFCSDLKDCVNGEDCGGGAICAVQTCCGRSVCLPAVCANPVASLTKLARRAKLGKRVRGEMTTNGRVLGRKGMTTNGRPIEA